MTAKRQELLIFMREQNLESAFTGLPSNIYKKLEQYVYTILHVDLTHAFKASNWRFAKMNMSKKDIYCKVIHGNKNGQSSHSPIQETG